MSSPADRRLQALPSVGEVMQQPLVAEWVSMWGREFVTRCTREAIHAERSRMLAGTNGEAAESRGELLAGLLTGLGNRMQSHVEQRLDLVINATGVVLHTSLGRAALSQQAAMALQANSRGCNLEVDLAAGDRRQRGHQLGQLFRDLTDAPAALVVNNNAAATVLTLSALAAGREVVISRGQLVEIGGSFRLPEIFAASGALLKEVGSTNRTHLADYERAIQPQTAALLRVHPSNYRIEGFTTAPEIEPLASLARRAGVLAIDDIGSGCLVDTTQFGLPREPTFRDSLRAGADLVLGSGDKLLGGPQCGILLGRQDLIDRLAAHPLARAFRIDKLTLAALQATLEAYVRGTHFEEIPTLQMLAADPAVLLARASTLIAGVAHGECRLDVAAGLSLVGGGALPGARLPTAVIRVAREGLGADAPARRLRTGTPRVFPRIDEGQVLIDLRSVPPCDDAALRSALDRLSTSR